MRHPSHRPATDRLLAQTCRAAICRYQSNRGQEDVKKTTLGIIGKRLRVWHRVQKLIFLASSLIVTKSGPTSCYCCLSTTTCTIYNPPTTTLSKGRAWPCLAPGRPDPTLRGPGSGQIFDNLARPSQGQGSTYMTWPDPGPTGVDPTRPYLRCVALHFYFFLKIIFVITRSQCDTSQTTTIDHHHTIQATDYDHDQ